MSRRRQSDPSKNEDLPKDVSSKFQGLTVRPHSLARKSDAEDSDVNMEGEMEQEFHYFAEVLKEGKFHEIDNINHWVKLSRIKPEQYLEDFDSCDLHNIIILCVKEISKNNEHKKPLIKILINCVTNLRRYFFEKSNVDVFAGTGTFETFDDEFRSSKDEKLLAASNKLKIPMIK